MSVFDENDLMKSRSRIVEELRENERKLLLERLRDASNNVSPQHRKEFRKIVRDISRELLD